jgi:hypothetical protein
MGFQRRARGKMKRVDNTRLKLETLESFFDFVDDHIQLWPNCLSKFGGTGVKELNEDDVQIPGWRVSDKRKVGAWPQNELESKGVEVRAAVVCSEVQEWDHIVQVSRAWDSLLTKLLQREKRFWSVHFSVREGWNGCGDQNDGVIDPTGHSHGAFDSLHWLWSWLIFPLPMTQGALMKRSEERHDEGRDHIVSEAPTVKISCLGDDTCAIASSTGIHCSSPSIFWHHRFDEEWSRQITRDLSRSMTMLHCSEAPGVNKAQRGVDPNEVILSRSYLSDVDWNLSLTPCLTARGGRGRGMMDNWSEALDPHRRERAIAPLINLCHHLDSMRYLYDHHCAWPWGTNLENSFWTRWGGGIELSRVSGPEVLIELEVCRSSLMVFGS